MSCAILLVTRVLLTQNLYLEKSSRSCTVTLEQSHHDYFVSHRVLEKGRKSS